MENDFEEVFAEDLGEDESADFIDAFDDEDFDSEIWRGTQERER